ncbi:MAG: peptidylprolyl isomerase [Acidobacteriota bacterium]
MLAACLLTPLASPIAAAAQEPVNRIVLRVNDEIVTLYEYQRRRDDAVRSILDDPRLSADARQERLADVGKTTMQQLYREALLGSQARRAGISVDESEVDSAVDQVMNEQNLETLRDLEAALTSANLTMTQLRDKLEQEIRMGRVIRRDVRVEIPEDELRGYYRNNPEEFVLPERRKLREVIVLDTTGDDDATLQARAERLALELEGGGDLEAVVTPYRERGESTGLIDLGWLRTDELGEELSGPAFELGAGEISAPIAARGGYHVLIVDEAEDGGVLPYADVVDRIRMRERQRRFSGEMRTFLAQLEKSSFIVEDVPPEAVGFRSVAELEIAVDDELSGFNAPLEPRFDETDASGEATGDPETGDSGGGVR